MAKKKSKEKWPASLLEEKYFNEFEVIDGLNQHPDGLSFEQWKEKNGYEADGIDYPENKRLKKMKRKANNLYKEMTQALTDAEEAHKRFHSKSTAYAKLLKEIEVEAQMPNFGER